MLTLYGIKSCDTVKRARQALQAAGIDHHFHDFKTDGLSPALAQRWLDQLGAETVINRRGTTWRKLSPAQQAAADSAACAELLAAQPSLVKRPVIDAAGELRVGFAKRDEAEVMDWLRTRAAH